MEDIELGTKNESEESQRLLGVVSNNTIASPSQQQTVIAKEERLLEAVLNNQIDTIKRIIDDSTSEDIILHKYAQHEQKTIVTIACTRTDVSEQSLEVLLSNSYCSIDHTDENWYGWEPLHYLARAAQPKKLQILVNHMENVDSLTYFSENALHVLLHYEKSVTPFDAALSNGSELKICTIIGTEKDNITECARILIDEGVDVNHANIWNETAISLAVRYRYINVIKLLLKVPHIDIDNYKESGKTIREYLKLNYIFLNNLPQGNFFQEDPVSVLFNFLKSGDEDSFLQYNNENIQGYVDLVDGNNEYNSCATMLQVCFRKGFLEYLQDEAYNKKLSKGDIMKNPMLNIFCSKGFSRCINHLLDNGANPSITNRKFKEPLLEAAAIRGYYPLVAILLQHKYSTVNSDDIFDILPKLFDNKIEMQNHHFYIRHVLYLLLNRLVAIHKGQRLSPKKLTVLNKVLCQLNLESDDSKIDDSGNICQILSLGCSLADQDSSKQMIVDRIHPAILRSHLDDCIDDNKFYYNSIVQDYMNDYSETKTIRFLTRDEAKKDLLQHPLIVHFIHNKWLRIFWFFYVDLFFYTLFLISIYAYMIDVHIGSSETYIKVSLYALLGFHVIKEAVQLIFLYHHKYFLDQSNYLELAVIAACFVTIFLPNAYSMVIAILSSTIIFFLLLGQLPIFTKYTVIFGSARYFIEYTAFYFIQFVSFAISFYIIFPFEKDSSQSKNNNNSTNSTTSTTEGDIFKSLFYTLIYFTGEFSSRVLEPELYPVFGRVIMTIFIFFMTIILNNLLVGLIVSDMDEIQKIGRLYKQMKTAMFIARTNSLIKRLHEFKSLPLIKRIINYIHIFRKGQCKVLDLNNCNHRGVFDDENKEYLKEIKNKRQLTFDQGGLKDIYEYIQNYSNESFEMRRVKERKFGDRRKILFSSQ